MEGPNGLDVVILRLPVDMRCEVTRGQGLAPERLLHHDFQRLLLKRSHDISPDMHIYDVNPAALLTGPDGEEADAALIIGDLAMDLDAGDFPLDLDLGEWWQKSFHRPFVYAFWAWRQRERESVGERLSILLHESHRRGQEDLDLIIEEAAVGHGWEEERVARYLRDRIHFALGASELEGLRLFHRLCVEDHLAPHRLSVEEALADLDVHRCVQAAPAG